MEQSDFREAFDGTAREESAHLSVDRARVTSDFVEEIVSEDENVGNLTVNEFLKMLKEEI